MVSRKIKSSIPAIVAVAFALAGAVGCQSEQHTSQAVNLRVTDKETGKPLSGASVTILRGQRDARNAHGNASDSGTAVNKKDLPSGKTDNDGNVRVIVDSAFLATDWTVGMMEQVDSSQTGPNADRLTNSTRQVEITKGDASETVPVKMTPGSAAQGETLQVFVQSISKPMVTAHGKGPG
jgi:hypothetical protein